MSPAISIIVPVYNVEKYLSKCVDSILLQTFGDFELILVDDGSLDGSSAICDNYAVMDSRVRVVHQNNGGVSSARNIGLSLSRGEYLCFVDSDDWISNVFLEVAFSEVRKQNLDMYISGFTTTDLTGRVIGDAVIKTEISIHGRKMNPDEKCTLLQKDYISGPCGKLYRRKIVDDVRFDASLCYGEDLKFVFTLLDRCVRVLAVPKAYYYYRTNPNSLTHTISDKKIESVIRTGKYLLNDYRCKYGNLVSTYRNYLGERFVLDCEVQIKMIENGNYTLKQKYKMLLVLLGENDVRKELREYNSFSKWWSYYPIYQFTAMQYRKWKKKRINEC